MLELKTKKQLQQLFVIDAPVYKVETVEITDVTITILGRTHQKIGFGNHRGNRFTVIVRGCADENGQPLEVESALERVHQRIDEMNKEYGTDKFPIGLDHSDLEKADLLPQKWGDTWWLEIGRKPS